MAHQAERLCSSTLVGDALRSIGLESPHVELALGGHGLRTALDLRLVGGLEAEELVDKLRLSGSSIGDRSKVRLLLGGSSHQQQLHDSEQGLSFMASASGGGGATGHDGSLKKVLVQPSCVAVC